MEVRGQVQVLVDFSSLTNPGNQRIEEWMGSGIFDVTRSHILQGFTNSKLGGFLITNSLFTYMFILTCDAFEDNYKL
jgi:hypothetical protein